MLHSSNQDTGNKILFKASIKSFRANSNNISLRPLRLTLNNLTLKNWLQIFPYTALTRFSFHCSFWMKNEPLFIFFCTDCCTVYYISLGLLKWSWTVSCPYLTFIEVFHTFNLVAGCKVSCIVIQKCITGKHLLQCIAEKHLWQSLFPTITLSFL